MNVIKGQVKKSNSIMYVGSISKSVDSCITLMSKNFDVYLYINKKSGINPKVFSSLLPITGYIYGNKTQSDGLLEILDYISKMHNYYCTYIPISTDTCQDEVNKIDELINRGILASSIFKSHETSFEYRSNKYKINFLDSILSRIFHLGVKGVNSTHKCDTGIVLMNSDINKITEEIRLNDDEFKSYIDSFNEIGELIPSLFSKLGINFINSELINL